jgi:hypothetical protein
MDVGPVEQKFQPSLVLYDQRLPFHFPSPRAWVSSVVSLPMSTGL